MAAAVSSAFVDTTISLSDEIDNSVFDQVQEEQINADLLEADADFERLLGGTSFVYHPVRSFGGKKGGYGYYSGKKGGYYEGDDDDDGKGGKKGGGGYYGGKKGGYYLSLIHI